MALLTLPDDEPARTAGKARALVFEDPRTRALLAEIERIAPSEAPVLVTGETGTGKEIVARQVHERSRRSGGAFVAVNCGALTESLVESELFGHERGAFTGATATRAGWFEAARGGTLFLDEVGELSPAVQVKLLRVLQEREVVRLGSRRAVEVDVRLVAATNVDLARAVRLDRFRADLYYRLHVATLAVLPLHERPGDVIPLAEHFLDVYAAKLGRPRPSLDASARAKLLAHDYPGNIRELENVMHRALLVCDGDIVAARDLRLTAIEAATPFHERPSNDNPRGLAALDAALATLLDGATPSLQSAVEERLYRVAYEHAQRNQLETARLLGVSRNVVRARLQTYGLLPGPRAATG